MAQLSRPFQLAALASATLVLGLFFVLHRPGASTSGGSSSSGVSATGGHQAGASSAGGSSSVHHSSTPGLEGLTHDIQRAHGAVAQTQQKAQEVQSKAAQAPGASSAAGAASGTAQTGASHAHGAPVTHPASHAHHAATHAPSGSHATASSILHHLTAAEHLSAVLSLLAPELRARIVKAEGLFIGTMKTYLRPASQSTVASELGHGKTVLLLFLNPGSYDDDATAIETVAAAHRLGHSVAVHFALASQVNAFGSVTRDIQVYQTPTLLIVNRKKQVTTLTGLTDSFAIRQAVAEARH